MSGDYWRVYSTKYGTDGWVNSKYLVKRGSNTEIYKVSVSSGYLALRTWPVYDSSNEIGELYTGDIFEVKDKSNGQYWWGYSSKLKANGYVNKDYLIKY